MVCFLFSIQPYPSITFRTLVQSPASVSSCDRFSLEVYPKAALLFCWPTLCFNLLLAELAHNYCDMFAGPGVWPGANFVLVAKDGSRKSLKYGDRRRTAAELKVPSSCLQPTAALVLLWLDACSREDSLLQAR